MCVRACAQARNKMSLGYTNPATGEFTKASSVQLRNTMRVSEDEATRKACYDVSDPSPGPLASR